MPWQDHFDRDELIVRIRRLAEDLDLTRGQVADVIGCGLNANMVSGFANRAKPKIVFGKARSDGRKKTAVSVSQPEPVIGSKLRFVILDEVEEFDPNKPVHFHDLRSAGGLGTGVPPAMTDGRCRYPLWPDRTGTAFKPKNFELLVCGKPVVPGTSWCPDCTKVVFEPHQPRPKPKRGEGRRFNADGRRAGWQYGF